MFPLKGDAAIKCRIWRQRCCFNPKEVQFIPVNNSRRGSKLVFVGQQALEFVLPFLFLLWRNPAGVGLDTKLKADRLEFLQSLVSHSSLGVDLSLFRHPVTERIVVGLRNLGVSVLTKKDLQLGKLLVPYVEKEM